jgi:DNA repair exonuclease SbcCD ATPase subunit
MTTKKTGAKIVEVKGSDFKGLQDVRITPMAGSHLIQITGANGAGKTSVQDLIRFLLKGQKTLPLNKASVIRNGTKEMRGSIRIAGEDIEFLVTRSIGRESGRPTLDVRAIRGTVKSSQEFLDDFLGELTFDPLYFVRLPEVAKNADEGKRQQIAILREASKVDIDFDALDAANAIDYKDRGALNKEIDTLTGQLSGITVLSSLPEKKLDESAILKKLSDAGELNRKAQEVFTAKQELGAAAARIGVERTQMQSTIDAKELDIKRLKQLVETGEKELRGMKEEEGKIAKRFDQAEAKFKAAPAGEPIDVSALTTELQSVQRTNRAIDERTRWQGIKDQIDAKQSKANALSAQMKARDEKKTNAVANAKMPVEGLTFDAANIEYKGKLFENLSESEQIRISTMIGMATNPKLRVMFIRNGESLDAAGIKAIQKLAIEHDFQVWMARVETSGKVGFVMEDGVVAKVNEDEPNA